MSKPLTRRSTDHSNAELFSFSFFCDICGKEWRSPAVWFETGGMAIEHEEARQMVWAHEHKTAFEQANLEAQMHFNNCTRCGKRVCEECFDTRDGDVWLCVECVKKGK
jgi:hypothetical protein